MKVDNQRTDHQIRLTAAELGELWTTYMNNSMFMRVLEYFKVNCQDREVLSVLNLAYQLSQGYLQWITELYRKENHAIPVAFTEKDVDPNVPALWSDVYFLQFVHHMSKISISLYGMALGTSVREDVLCFFHRCVRETQDLYDHSLKTLLSKGVYTRCAYIPIPEKMDFIDKQGYLTGWLGNRRVLNAIEITQLYTNIQRNAIGKALALGFAQTARSERVRKFMKRGAGVAQKNVEVLSHILLEENINVPPTFDTEVLQSTAPPFSDKLMLFMIGVLTQIAIGFYGTAIGSVFRKDLTAKFTRILIESGEYAEDGVNIMIDQAMLEEPPQALSNRDLMKQR